MTKQQPQNWTAESFFVGLFFIGAIVAYFFMDTQTAILLALLALVIKPQSAPAAPTPSPDADPRLEMESRRMGK